LVGDVGHELVVSKSLFVCAEFGRFDSVDTFGESNFVDHLRRNELGNRKFVGIKTKVKLIVYKIQLTHRYLN
tara:strand:+ start:2211 stop:2426 length:216 start_codon:yes stop_codon:yes gene_type:complete